MVVPNPATPGVDFSGTIVKPAKRSLFKPGDKVFGTGPSAFAGGCLAEYAVVGTNTTVALPEGLSMQDASTIGVAGLTALQSIKPYASNSSRLFLNGGSGGTGVFGIQIAKALGCEVTVTCSECNEELCRSLGADQVINYTKHKSLPEALSVSSKDKYDHVVDNVMSTVDLYSQAQKYSRPGAKIVVVAGSPTIGFVLTMLKLQFLPVFLGGCPRNVLSFFAQMNNDELLQIGEWMAEGKVKAVVDAKFSFDDAPEAFAKLKTGWARGKIVVSVQGD